MLAIESQIDNELCGLVGKAGQFHEKSLLNWADPNSLLAVIVFSITVIDIANDKGRRTLANKLLIWQNHKIHVNCNAKLTRGLNSSFENEFSRRIRETLHHVDARRTAKAKWNSYDSVLARLDATILLYNLHKFLANFHLIFIVWETRS